MSLFAKAALLAVTASLSVATAAQAQPYGGIKNFSFSLQDSYLGDPLTFVFVPRQGKYVFDGFDGSPVKLRLKGEKYRRARITGYQIYLGHPHSGGKKIASHGHQEGSWRKVDRQVSFNDRNLLKGYETRALRYCQQHGDPRKRVVKDMDILFTGWMQSKGKNLSQSAKNASVKKATRYAKAKIVCLPEPFKVTDADLTIKRHGPMTACPADVTLTAKFKTNKPGKFTFRLYRGDGAFRDVEMTANNAGRATYSHKYKFNKSTQRRYLVAVIGGTQVSSPWKQMTVNCAQPLGGGSMTTGPRPGDH